MRYRFNENKTLQRARFYYVVKRTIKPEMLDILVKNWQIVQK